MLTNIRQGIISTQLNAPFLTINGGKVDINTNEASTDITFAQGQNDYLFSEVENVTGAWGPFSSTQNYWLYWDIDSKTAIRTFGMTQVAPMVGSVLPISNLTINLHFFDLTDKKMKVWNGNSWEVKIRVFAGKVLQGSLTQNNIGSQVGLSGSYNVGYILFDQNDNPLFSSLGSQNNFVTTETLIHTQFDPKNSYKIDGLSIDGIALESIPAYHAVCWKGPKQLGVASNVQYQFPCIGISIENSGKNQLNHFVTKGFLTNYNNWNWQSPANTPLFVDSLGNVTDQVPQQYSLQKIGHIVSPDTIFVNIDEIILLETSIPSPSATPTISITPSSSLLLSPSPTITPTPTPTPSSVPSDGCILVAPTFINAGYLISDSDPNTISNSATAVLAQWPAPSESLVARGRFVYTQPNIHQDENDSHIEFNAGYTYSQLKNSAGVVYDANGLSTDTFCQEQQDIVFDFHLNTATDLNSTTANGQISLGLFSSQTLPGSLLVTVKDVDDNIISDVTLSEEVGTGGLRIYINNIDTVTYSEPATIDTVTNWTPSAPVFGSLVVGQQYYIEVSIPLL